MILEIVRLERPLLDRAERLAVFAQKVVLLQVGRYVVLPEEKVELLHLLLGHAEDADGPHGQLLGAEAAVAEVLDEAVVLGAHVKGGLDRGPGHLVPVETHLLDQLLLEPDEPLLGHCVGDRPVARPDDAALGLLLLGRLGQLPLVLVLVGVLVGRLAVEEPEAAVAEAGVAVEAGKLLGELLLFLRLELGHVEWGVQHAELEAAVVAAVGAGPPGVDVERARLLRHNS